MRQPLLRAIVKAPPLNSRNFPSRDRVPSGKMKTLRFMLYKRRHSVVREHIPSGKVEDISLLALFRLGIRV